MCDLELIFSTGIHHYWKIMSSNYFINITGFKPEKYRCTIPECDGTNTDFSYDNLSFHNVAIQSNDSLSNIQSIFVQDENGVVGDDQ